MGEPTRTARVWPNLAIVIAAGLTFARALPYPLQRSWDDERFLIEFQNAAQPSWAALVSFFTQRHFEAYHPLHLLSYWLDVPWFGAEPLAVHTTNLLLWMLALGLTHACLRALPLTPTAAVLGTLLVGLHPVQVEAVSWATGRKDILALLFSSAFLLTHLRSQGPLSGHAWLSRGLFLLAALSKTTTLPLPVFALALDWLLQRRSRRDAWLHAAPALVLALGLGVVAVLTWQENEMVRTTLGGALAAPLRWATTVAHQAGAAFWPSAVSPMYSTVSVGNFSVGALLWPAALAGLFVIAQRSNRPLMAAGILGFVILLLPASNLVPMYFPLQDRYLSLPLLGLAIATAAFVDAWAHHTKTRTPHVVLGVLCVALATRTVQYQGEWSSEQRLWGHAASTQPDAQYAWMKLSAVRRDAGDLEGAIQAGRQLVRVAPSHRLAWATLFEASALRDERHFGIAPSRARELAKTFYERIDRADALRTFAAELLAAGYLRTLELPLACALVLAPMPDTVIEAAAKSQLRSGRPSIARFYAHRMGTPPSDPSVSALLGEAYFPILP
jgi:protein O-mannosyl-transferase